MSIFETSRSKKRQDAPERSPSVSTASPSRFHDRLVFSPFDRRFFPSTNAGSLRLPLSSTVSPVSLIGGCPSPTDDPDDADGRAELCW